MSSFLTSANKIAIEKDQGRPVQLFQRTKGRIVISPLHLAWGKFHSLNSLANTNLCK
jgi:hypothetical protein